MVLGSDKIFELIHTENLIENLNDGFIIEGCTVDFRLDSIFKHEGEAVLMEDRRNTGKVIEENYDENLCYYLQPSIPYLLSTIEKVNIPNNIVMLIDTRTTMFRSGIILKATYTNPGYSGILTFMAINTTKKPVLIQQGFRIAQAGFMQIEGKITPYCGRWQEGRIHTANEFVGSR